MELQEQRHLESEPDIDFDDDKPSEECGVFGIYAPGLDVARYTIFGLQSLQHRGQESAGIAVGNTFGSIEFVKGMGLVNQVFNQENTKGLKGCMAIGHTRYSTTGASKFFNAQPVVIESNHGQIAVAQNGNLVGGEVMRKNVLERGVGLFLSTDCELITQMLCKIPPEEKEKLEKPDWVLRIKNFMAECEGAYSLAVMTKDGIFGVRDRIGLRPLCVGEIDIRSLGSTGETLQGVISPVVHPTMTKGYVLASESCAIATVGGRLIREILPGEIVKIDQNGITAFQALPPRNPPAFCIFEYVYFARPDSLLEGKLVHEVRRRLGANLAKEHPVPEADFIMPVPDSGIPAALGYAQQINKPFNEGLTKNRYIGRTFIQPTQSERKISIALKFNPLPQNLKGKRVVLIDDSIVRGNTLNALIRLIKEAGALEVHVRITCPPVRHPCYMGIDMATYDQLIAHKKSIEEIRQYIGANSLGYLSYEGMIDAVQSPGHCAACYTGEYPLKIDW